MSFLLVTLVVFYVLEAFDSYQIIQGWMYSRLMALTHHLSLKPMTMVVIIAFSVSLISHNASTFNVYAQQRGGSATSGAATGGAATGSSGPCYNCVNNIYGGPANSGAANGGAVNNGASTGGAATGGINNNNSAGDNNYKQGSPSPTDVLSWIAAGDKLHDQAIMSLANDNMALYKDELEQSLQFYEKALSIDPNNKQALKGKATILVITGNYAEAIQYYDKILALDPNDRFGLTQKAHALVKLGNYAEAIAYDDKRISLDPKDTSALDDKGDALVKQRKYAEAIQYYDQAISIDPRLINPIVGKSNALAGEGNYAEAIIYFDKVLDSSLIVGKERQDALEGKQNALSHMHHHHNN